MDKPKFSLTGEEREKIMGDKTKTPEQREEVLKTAMEKLDKATDRLRGSKEINEYEVETEGLVDHVQEQKLIKAAENKYEAIMNHYLDRVSRLTNDEKIDIIEQLNKYLVPILSIETKEAEDIRKKMQEFEHQLRESL